MPESPILPADLSGLRSAALQAVADPVCIADRTGTIIDVNDAFCRQNGWSADEARGRNPRILKSGLTEAAVYADMWSTILAGRTWSGEVANRRKDGSVYLAELTISPVLGADGGISHFVATQRDATRRLRTEQALSFIVEGTARAVGDDFFRSLVRSLALALGTRSAMVCRLLEGGDRGRSMAFWADGEFRDNLDLPMTAACGKASAGGPCSCARDLGGALGTAPMSGCLCMPLVDPGGKVLGHLSVFDTGPLAADSVQAKVLRIFGARAAAELARLLAEEALRAREQQLRQSQKMEVVGRLAGGIAHDFNNLLTVILGCGSLLKPRLADDAAARADLQEIVRAGERAAALTRQLLAFSRKQVLRPEILDLRDVVSELQKMVRRLIGEDIALGVSFPLAPLKVKVDRGQIEQVVMNLVVNARDAMPRGGRISIEGDLIELDSPRVHRHGTVPPGSYVRLLVLDTGCGMSEDVQTHLFEPFFTTKEKGKGSGLGLSTAFGIVTQSSGHLVVETQAGAGSSFHIYLPREDGPVRAPTPPARNRRGRCTGTILLVEDAPAVRALAARVLSEAGFTVIPTGDPNEAFSIVERRGSDIALLLTDVVLPGLSGVELARRARAACPGMRTLFMSGYTEHFVLSEMDTHGGDNLLQKPFIPEALVEKVHDILKQP